MKNNPHLALGIKDAADTGDRLTSAQFNGRALHKENEVNAVRHAMWNALMVKRTFDNLVTQAAHMAGGDRVGYAVGKAKEFADAHENNPRNYNNVPKVSIDMDYHNNEVGRQVAAQVLRSNPNATDADIEKAVMAAYEQGRLVERSGDHLVTATWAKAPGKARPAPARSPQPASKPSRWPAWARPVVNKLRQGKALMQRLFKRIGKGISWGQINAWLWKKRQWPWYRDFMASLRRRGWLGQVTVGALGFFVDLLTSVDSEGNFQWGWVGFAMLTNILAVFGPGLIAKAGNLLKFLRLGRIAVWFKNLGFIRWLGGTRFMRGLNWLLSPVVRILKDPQRLSSLLKGKWGTWGDEIFRATQSGAGSATSRARSSTGSVSSRS
jgi:hypothetical protein